MTIHVSTWDEAQTKLLKAVTNPLGIFIVNKIIENGKYQAFPFSDPVFTRFEEVISELLPTGLVEIRDGPDHLREIRLVSEVEMLRKQGDKNGCSQ